MGQNIEEKALEYHIKMLRTVEELCQNGLKNTQKPKDSLEQLRDDLELVQSELQAIKDSIGEVGEALIEMARFLKEEDI